MSQRRLRPKQERHPWQAVALWRHVRRRPKRPEAGPAGQDPVEVRL